MQLMPLVLTLREVMTVAAILDSLEMAQHAVCGQQYINIYSRHLIYCVNLFF